MNGLRAIQLAGVGLAVVMMILMVIGTRSMATFLLWGALAVAGLAVAGLARRADEQARQRDRDEDFRRRQGTGT